MTKPLIRPADPAELPAIAALIARSARATNAADYPPDAVEILVGKFTPERLLERLPGRDVLVAVERGTAGIVGTGSLGVSPVLGAPRPKLHALFVAPERQRQGIGAALVRQIEALARSRGIDELHLSATLTARPFYEALGWTVLHYEERDVPTWLMRTRL